MTADDAETPTPEFRAQLEWEIARTFRREARLGTPVRHHRRRRLRAAAIVIACVALGTGSNFAMAQVRDVARRDSLLEAARAELSIAALRLDLARARAAAASQQAKMGLLSREEQAAADAELEWLQVQAAKLQLNIEEIRAASQPPRDELNAPLVGARDFVKERIQLDLAGAQQGLVQAESALREAERRMQTGVVSELAGAQAKLDVIRAQATFMVLAERLSLRREFVEKGTPADQLATRLEVAQLRADMRAAVQSLELARTRAQTMKRQRSVGAVTELDLMRAELDVKERELEVSHLAMQLQRLGEGKRAP